MSIYATLWHLQFPQDEFGFPDEVWLTVWAQGVPAHIGTPTPGHGYEDGDPYGAFLPPPVQVDTDGDAPFLRAVVFVTPATRKGTARSGQEYEAPLLVLTGEAYARMPFVTLHRLLSESLQRP